MIEHSRGHLVWFLTIACWAIAKDWLFGSRSRFSVVPLDGRDETVVDDLRRLEPKGVDAVLEGNGGDRVDHCLAVLRPGGVLVEHANSGSPARRVPA